MKTLVVYASRKGNTRRVAEEIGRVMADLGPVELFEVADAPSQLPASDIVFVGGPTEGHSANPPMVRSSTDLHLNRSPAGRRLSSTPGLRGPNSCLARQPRQSANA